MIRPFFTLAAVAALAACTAPQAGFTVSPDALERADQISSDTLVPRVSSRTTIQAFEEFCGRYPANSAGTRRAAQSAGYFLLGTGTADGLEMWASDSGRPLVATGSRDGADVCMVMVKEDSSLGSAVASYVQSKHGEAATNMGQMQFGADTAEDLWLVPQQPPIIYFTLIQQQPGLGSVQAFAQVTE